MSFLKKSIFLVGSLLFNIVAVADQGPYLKPLFVLDAKNNASLPRNFRTTSDEDRERAGNDYDWTGFDELRAAGGGEFSQISLEKIRQKLDVDSFTVIDLRQESHGFLNGMPVSWYAPHDAINENKTIEQIEKSEAEKLERLRGVKQITVYKILKKNSEEIIERAKPQSLEVLNVDSEADVAKREHINYERLYIQDFHAPTPDQVDRFLQIVKRLPVNEWVYFHCRAGVGRTTTFMAMYDMLRNAKSVSFENILKRQAAIGGKDFTTIPDANPWKYPYAKERFEFLRKFYDYARTNKDDFTTSWSDWLKENNK